MKRMGWVVLALVAMLFVSCSKESSPGPAGPQGAAGATGATGAAGIPRKMYIESEWQYETGINTNGHSWSYTTYTLPWVPASNGVIVNFRGFMTSQSGPSECYISSWTVNGTSVTIDGWVWAYYVPYNYSVEFDVIAYDTLNTVMYVNKKPPNAVRLSKTPAPAVKLNLP